MSKKKQDVSAREKRIAAQAIEVSALRRENRDLKEGIEEIRSAVLSLMGFMGLRPVGSEDPAALSVDLDSVRKELKRRLERGRRTGEFLVEAIASGALKMPREGR